MTKILLETINLKKIIFIEMEKLIFLIMLIWKSNKGILYLVGPSGSGKSSFLHLIALLDVPTKGKILLKNKDTKYLSENEKDQVRRNNISIIFQDNNLLTILLL